MSGPPLFQREDFRRAVGAALRPGGLELTAKGLGHCRLPTGSRVVDVGCGRGASLALLTELGHGAVGLDPAPELLVEARRLAPEAMLLRATAEDLPLASGICDAVLCECVLSLTVDPQQALRELRRILRPGGWLVVADLYLRQPSVEAHSLAAGCATGAVGWDIWEQRLQSAGFAIVLGEDHSRSLAELAGHLLFAGLPTTALGLCGHRSKPGYAQWIARAEGP